MTSSLLQFHVLSMTESLDESLNTIAEELPDYCFSVITICHLEVPLVRSFGCYSLVGSAIVRSASPLILPPASRVGS